MDTLRTKLDWQVFARVTWGKRHCERDDAARQICIYLNEIADISEVFSEWRKTGQTRKSAQQTIEITQAGVGRFLTSNHDEFSGKPIEGFGLGFDAWNKKSCKLTIQIGETLGVSPNLAGLECDEGLKALAADEWRRLLQTAIRIFDADEGTITLSKYSTVDGWTHKVWIQFQRGSAIRELPLT